MISSAYRDNETSSQLSSDHHTKWRARDQLGSASSMSFEIQDLDVACEILSGVSKSAILHRSIFGVCIELNQMIDEVDVAHIFTLDCSERIMSAFVK